MNPHETAASLIIPRIVEKIKSTSGIYTISLAGESGSGKTETSKALISELNQYNISAAVLGQDNYFFLPPVANDAMRKKDPTWLGPHKEVDLSLMDSSLLSAMKGVEFIEVPQIDYYSNVKSTYKLDLTNLKVIIAEGTYTTLLKNINTRIFISADYHDTLQYRKLRNRGNEVNDPFVEGILETEHKIIAGHRFIADFVITKDYEVL